MKNKKIILGILIFIVLVVGLRYSNQQSLNSQERPVYEKSDVLTSPAEGLFEISVAQTPVSVTIAADGDSRSVGLSNTLILPEGEGKLFVFQESGQLGFWMKDMYIPLDILWFSEGGDLVHIEENVLPDSYPKIYKPKAGALYVLEVNSGFVASKGIKINDRLTLSSDLTQCIKETCF